MILHNLKKVGFFEVRRWLMDNIPDLTKRQKDAIESEDGFVRWNDFTFFVKADKKKRSILMRLTLIPYAITWLCLFIFLPFNFLITGTWKYDKIEWFVNWARKLF